MSDPLRRALDEIDAKHRAEPDLAARDPRYDEVLDGYASDEDFIAACGLDDEL